MVGKLALNIAFLFLATTGWAGDGLVISAKVDPRLRDEAQRIYVSSCATVEREFGAGRSLRPRVILLLGANRDSVDWGRGEIRLSTWDPNLFAQGVITLAYRQLLPLHVNLTATEALRVRPSKEHTMGYGLRSPTRQLGPAGRLEQSSASQQMRDKAAPLGAEDKNNLPGDESEGHALFELISREQLDRAERRNIEEVSKLWG